MRKFTTLLVALSLVFTVTNVARADDVDPPSWRGGPLSTFAQWEFEIVTDDNPPQIVDNPFAPFGDGPAPPNVFEAVDDDDPETYLSDFPPGMFGEPGSDGNIYGGRLPNFIDEEPLKYIRFQVTWLSENPTGPDDRPIVTVEGFEAGVSIPGVLVDQYDASIFSGGLWGAVTVYDFELRPNPDFEDFQIATTRPDIYLDQVVVDTISLPEPSSFLLLGLSSVALLRRR